MSMAPDPGSQDEVLPSIESTSRPEPRYQGVGGWLLFLCVSLTILSPAVTAISLLVAFAQTNAVYEKFPGLLVVTLIDTVLSILLMALSIWTGLALWRVQPGAVVAAKRYLMLYVGYHIVAAVLPFLAGLPTEVNEAMIPEVFKQLVRGIIFAAVWTAYLNQSKRVKATFELA